MPWSDNSDSGSKPGGKPGPWGAPPSGGGGRGPDNDEPPRPRGNGPRRPAPPQPPEELGALLRRLRRQFEPFLGPPGAGAIPRLAGIAVCVLALFWLVSGFYVVQPNEQAVVTTFGAWTRTDGPGLRYHLPTPIENVDKVPVTALNQFSVGDDQTPNLMLTGDQDIVDMDFTVQWRINDAAKYIFQVKDTDDAVRSVAESAIREVVGKTQMANILTTGRAAVQDQTRDLMQVILDHYQAGVTVVDVQIHPNAPREVIPDAQAVTAASEYADSAVNEARTYQNRVVNEAKGDAAKAIAQAQAYREQVVLEAQGDAARFTELDQEYRRSPAVTRERLYLETMQRVLANSNKVIVDAKGSSAPIILPPDAFKPRAPVPAATAQPSAELAPAPAPQPAAPQAQAQPQGASQ